MGVTLIKKNGSLNLTAPTLGGGGSSVEEVYVGTEQPFDYNIKLWVDTDAESNYYTKTEVDEKLDNVSVDLTGYATEKYVQEQIAGIDIPDPDLSAYALKTDIPSLDGYAKTEDIPSVEGLATEEYVNTLVGGIDTLLDDINGEVI